MLLDGTMIVLSDGTSCIATPSQVDRIEPILEHIAQSLYDYRWNLDAGLCSGFPGAALYLAHYSRHTSDLLWMDRAAALIEQVKTCVPSSLPTDFFSGGCGLGWALEQLQSEEFFGLQDGDLNEDTDRAILECLNRSAWLGSYDLVSGLVGMGAYALERLPRVTAAEILQRILGHLEAMAEPMGEGIVWSTPPAHLPKWQRELCPNGYINLGLAHGLPCIFFLLASMYAYGIEPLRAKRLLDGGIRWYRSQQQVGTSVNSFFPDWYPLNGDLDMETSSSRIAWCYGDLGASVALFCVGNLIHDKEIIGLAVEMANSATDRSILDSGIKDAGLCHGSAGNAHLFRQIYRGTGDVRYMKAAQLYIEETLKHYRLGQGFAGFQAYRPNSDESMTPFQAMPGLLDGAAGIGLALIGSIGKVNSSWDRFMFVSSIPLLCGSDV
jgi:lantibiotic modifying enzyme